MRSTSADALTRRSRRAHRRAQRRAGIVAAAAAFSLIAVAGVTALPTSEAEASTSSFGDFTLASFSTTVEPTPVVSLSGTDEISTAVRTALADADAALAASVEVSSQVDASGLDLGDTDTDIDTDALEDAADRLTASLDLPAPLLPGIAEQVADAVSAVEKRVDAVRTDLEAAQKAEAERLAAEAEAQRIAEEEAAAAAAAEAEAEAAEAAASTGSSSASAAPSRPAGVYTPAGDAQSIAYGMLGGYGWGDDQFGCLVELWNKESGWNSQAYNASSGAYGIPQALPGSKMASAGADWETNAATQISWGLGYIAGRYGSPCGAWQHSQSVGWY
ncbi:lytic transglycosylase domain-containing protein [Microbacterium aurantiacum]|uniref:aggregation-promoting factor C-terminal-like domain-containing protein n=1 Tax=Microbacterium aurantiacum TaxID=162393 RepID=UPI0006AD4BE2|nr:lytic transglycosylase domain-containing protein [Microbacterium chocolatum]ANG86336.1 16S rRNA pseudouridylate synthase [Microbacterium chocolatum]